MSNAADEKVTRKTSRWGVAVSAGAYAVAFGAFAFFASRHVSGVPLMAVIVLVECAVLAAVAALAAVEVDPGQLGIRRFLVRLLGVCGLAVAANSLVLLLAAAAWGAGPLLGGLLAQLVILAFCLLVGAGYALVRSVGAEPFLAQLVCITVAAVLLGTVFYADPLVESQRSTEGKSTVIRAALAVNPATAISWSLLGFDLMRQQIMYDRVSVIGRYYQTPYPKWWQTAVGYVIVSAVFLAVAGLVRRFRNVRTLKRRQT